MPGRLKHYLWVVQRRRRERQEWAHIKRSMTTDRPFFAAAQLPGGYGAGISERAVEFGWAFAQGPAGRALDAGSTFNHALVLDEMLSRVSSLSIYTLVPEPVDFAERGVSYAFGDLRSMPYADDAFDFVASISVLEHVGKDNTGYGAAPGAAEDPNLEVERAVREMRRVLAPGGLLVLTVPFGAPFDHGWFRVYGRDDLAQLCEAAGASTSEVTVFAATDRGWQVSSLEESQGAGYADWKAGAVACLAVRPEPLAPAT